MSLSSYLANDMEEDNQAPKQAIFSFLYGKNRSERPLFHKLRFQFIRSMNWRTRVSREECEEVCWLEGFGVWGPMGERGGAARDMGIWDQKELRVVFSWGRLSSRSRLLIQTCGCGGETASL